MSTHLFLYITIIYLSTSILLEINGFIKRLHPFFKEVKIKKLTNIVKYFCQLNSYKVLLL